MCASHDLKLGFDDTETLIDAVLFLCYTEFIKERQVSALMKNRNMSMKNRRDTAHLINIR